LDCCLQDIEILIFSVMGIKLGVDTAQVNAILEMDQASGRDLPVTDIDNLITLCVEPVVYKSPKVLLVKRHSSTLAIKVDRVEEIELVRLDRIQPMPVLIEKCMGTKAIWGSVADGDEIILLIDFYKLSCGENISE
jgi:chemotaxis signal transduction protein